jgi:hypothetical protein
MQTQDDIIRDRASAWTNLAESYVRSDLPIPPYVQTTLASALRDAAELAARDIAAYMVDLARTSGAEPIVFVTSNNYMPPLRSFSAAEEIWQAANYDDGTDLFGYLYELLEDILQDADVYLGEPEYDNSLYVVDLRRFQAIEDPENAETLDGEWEAKNNG